MRCFKTCGVSGASPVDDFGLPGRIFNLQPVIFVLNLELLVLRRYVFAVDVRRAIGGSTVRHDVPF